VEQALELYDISLAIFLAIKDAVKIASFIANTFILCLTGATYCTVYIVIGYDWERRTISS